jgi:proteasome alpha subunit
MRGCHVIQTDPSGAVWAYKAVSVGSGSDTVKEFLETKYRDDLTLEESILLAVECLSKVVEGTFEPEKLKLAIVPADTKKLVHLTDKEVMKYIRKLES